MPEDRDDTGRDRGGRLRTTLAWAVVLAGIALLLAVLIEGGALEGTPLAL